CWFQIKVALAIYETKDVIGTAATSSGKTLLFWIALLMVLEDGEDKMEVIVTPLNILGKQTIQDLAAADVNAIAVSKENANECTFQEIENGMYQVMVINLEILMGNTSVEALWRKPKFTMRLLCFIFDEDHCISQWGAFQNEYLMLGNLQYLIPEEIPFYVASAALLLNLLLDVTKILHLQRETKHITCSNDRPNIHLVIQEIKYTVTSYADLSFLIPDNFKEGNDPPNKFLVFFDNTKEVEAAIRYLHTQLPPI
ncbi:hypothetical protein L208DRAFT_1206909, partial [Tricholoma matsutake]